jgi:hypothetical protein
MQLREALLRAIPFAGDEGNHAHVAVVPALFNPQVPVEFQGAQPIPHRVGLVMATNGVTGVIIPLDTDVDVPFVAPLAANLKKVLAVMPKGESPVFGNMGKVVMVASSAGQFLMPALEDPGGASFPVNIPETMKPVLEQTLLSLKRVVHCTLHDEDRPLLGHVHVTPWWAEATDQDRVARVNHQGLVPHSMLLHPDIFRNWKSVGPLGAAVATGPDAFWMQLGEELRFCKHKPSTDYFHLDMLLTGAGFNAKVLGAPFLAGLGKAQKTSPIDVVELVLGAGTCRVFGRNADGDLTSEEAFPLDTDATETVRIALRASYVKEAVGAALARNPHDVVDLSYLTATSPLRVGCGLFTEAVWPLFQPDEGKHAND